MRNFLLGIVFAVVIGGLFLLNPTKESFSKTYAAQINGELATDLGLESGNPVGDFFGDISESMIEEYLKAEVKQTNYILASVFEVPMSGEDLRVLGIAGQYFSLD